MTSNYIALCTLTLHLSSIRAVLPEVSGQHLGCNLQKLLWAYTDLSNCVCMERIVPKGQKILHLKNIFLGATANLWIYDA